MTLKEKEAEKSDPFLIFPYHKQHEVTDVVTVPTYNPKYATETVEAEREIFNFSSGMATFCIDEIVQNQDLMSARERIKSDREKGKILE